MVKSSRTIDLQPPLVAYDRNDRKLFLHHDFHTRREARGTLDRIKAMSTAARGIPSTSITGVRTTFTLTLMDYD
jgi:hypothetical protein